MYEAVVNPVKIHVKKRSVFNSISSSRWQTRREKMGLNRSEAVGAIICLNMLTFSEIVMIWQSLSERGKMSQNRPFFRSGRRGRRFEFRQPDQFLNPTG